MRGTDVEEVVEVSVYEVDAAAVVVVVVSLFSSSSSNIGRGERSQEAGGRGEAGGSEEGDESQLERRHGDPLIVLLLLAGWALDCFLANVIEVACPGLVL
ncbi:hypothetical protein B0O99DRAFT_685774 [Bisporella sp. PMI_857]|nr:hypothetical protein B0O99DRAFT_685774 [Bisporella sp. PMI_857]